MVSPQHSGRFVHGAARRTEASGGPIGKPDNKLNGMEKASLCRHTCVQTHRDAVSSLAKQHAWAIGSPAPGHDTVARGYVVGSLGRVHELREC